MSMDKHGFLSEDLQNVQKHIREIYAPHFDLVHRVNASCQQAICRLSIHNRDGQQVLAACLLIKLLNDVQGAVLLTERGLASPARTLLRAGLEALFVLMNVCVYDEFYMSFIRESEIDRLRLARAIRENPSPVFDDVRHDVTPELIERLTNEIKEAGTTKEAAAELARQVDLGEVYDGAYRLLSQDVHASPRVLAKYFDMDEAGTLKGIVCGPVTDDLILELDTSAVLMIMGCRAIDRLFGLNLHTDIDNLDMELKDMIENRSKRE